MNLEHVALLDINELPPGRSESPFNIAVLSKIPERSFWMSAMFSSAPAEAAERAVDQERRRVAQELAVVGFEPAAVLFDAVLESVRSRGLPVKPLALGEAAAEAARSHWVFDEIPSDVDALLDIQIVGAGYFPARAAGGYSPALYVRAALLATAGGGAILESFDYNADHRDAKGDRRFVTTPRELNVASPAEFSSKAELIRNGMTAISRRIADLLSTDIRRAVEKQPRLR